MHCLRHILQKFWFDERLIALDVKNNIAVDVFQNRCNAFRSANTIRRRHQSVHIERLRQTNNFLAVGDHIDLFATAHLLDTLDDMLKYRLPAQ